MPCLPRTLFSFILLGLIIGSDISRAQEPTSKVEVKVKEPEKPRGETEREIFGKIARKLSTYKPADNLDEIDQMFLRFSNGQDVWDRSAINHKALGEVFARVTSDLNITNGQITRKQFRFYAEQNLREGSGKLWKQPPPEKMDKQEKKEAKLEAKIEQQSPTSSTAPAKRDDTEETVTIWRYGKLPTGLPDWFTKLDTDKDGQIGLYEWRADGRGLDGFVIMDRNNDGLLTAQEWFDYAKDQGANIKPDSKSAARR